jgi:hypothetical protein
MSRTMSNVFDEKFLLNFTLGSLPISVADMLLVDFTLADKQSCNHCDNDVLEKADRNIGITDSPEATRHQAEVDDDRVLICSQRCRSPIQCEDATHSAEKIGAPGNNFSVLSPIMREGFDVSIFDQDQHCDLGTTFNLFGSPDEYGSSRTAVIGNQNTSGSSNRMSLNKSQSSSPDHMSVDMMDSFNLNINAFSRLSLEPTDSDRRKKHKDKEKNKNKEKGEVLILEADKHSRTFQKKCTKMKQTTVTFFYDSDDEINENSDFDLDDQSTATTSRELKSTSGLNGRSRGRSKQCGYGVRSTHSLAPSLPLALAPCLEMRMKMKNKSSMLSRDTTHSNSATCFDSTSLPLHGHLTSTISSATAAKTPVNPHLQRWMINVSNCTLLKSKIRVK